MAPALARPVDLVSLALWTLSSRCPVRTCGSGITLGTLLTLWTPVAPVSPLGPCSPCGPWAPVAPVAPVSPLGPCSPCGPWAPVAPVAPVSPLGTLLTLWTLGSCCTGVTLRDLARPVDLELQYHRWHPVSPWDPAHPDLVDPGSRCHPCSLAHLVLPGSLTLRTLLALGPNQ